jgi:hypothetical protein
MIPSLGKQNKQKSKFLANDNSIEVLLEWLSFSYASGITNFTRWKAV